MSQIPFDVPSPASGSVESDISCRKCSYNLRGMPLDGRCPECGTPVGVSVNGELLRYSDPEFLETLRRGINFILWGIVALIALMVISVVLGAGKVVAPNSPVFQILGFFAGLPMVIGGWLLTTPDPGGIGEDQYGTSRKIIRVCLAIGLLNNLFSFIAGLAGPLSPPAQIGFGILEFAAGIIGLVGAVAQLLYLKKLALRIPDPKLSSTATTVIWGLGISYGGIILFGAIMLFAVIGAGRGTPNPSPLMAMGCGMGLFALVALVFGIMYLVMLTKFGRHFGEQATLARSLWNRGNVQPPAGLAP